MGEQKGMITNQRVLDVEPPKMEVSFSRTGKYRGVDATVMVTYSSSLRSGGTMYGEGKGMLMSQDGQEMVTFTGQGIGHFVGPGKNKICWLSVLQYSFNRETGIP